MAISLESVSRRTAWAYNQKLSAVDIPWTVDAPSWLGFHDRDLAMDHTAIGRMLDNLGDGIRYMSGSEYSAYLHANIRQREALEFVAEYDDHYCAWFSSHPSRWTVHLSDDVRRSLGDSIPEKQTITIPKGGGTHVLWSATGNGQPKARTPR